jgi:transposase
VFEPTGSQRDAASAIFNLPDYRVLSAIDADDGIRRVEVESTDPPGCPVCGVLAARVDSRRRQWLRDLPVAGPVELVWVKRNLWRSRVSSRRACFGFGLHTPPRVVCPPPNMWPPNCHIAPM